MNILIDGNFPIKILPGTKKKCFKSFFPCYSSHKCLNFCNHGWKNLIKPPLTSRILKEDLTCTYFSTQTAMPSLKLFWKTNGLQTCTDMCLVKWALTKGRLWILWPAVSLHLRKLCGSVDSGAKAPDQDDWTALGKCFELEPSVYPSYFT